MAEVLLGVASGAVGIMAFAIQVMGIVVEFGSDWKNAPEDIKGFIEEVRALHKTLSASSNLVIDPNFVKAFEGEEALIQTATDTSLLIENCSERLGNFLQKYRGDQQKNSFERSFDRFKNALRATGLKENVKTLDRCCRQLNDMVTIDTARLVSKLVVETRNWHTKDENGEILKWLSSLNFRSKQEKLLERRCPGTGQWILNHDDFKKWRDGTQGSTKTLWCSGIAGAGKTVTTAVVINHLQTLSADQANHIAYIYCDYADSAHQTTASLVSSLLKQVVVTLDELPANIRESYKSHSKDASPLSRENASKLLSEVIATLECSPTNGRLFFLIDALEEHASEDTSPLKFLDHIRKTVGQNSHIFVTSRPHLDVRTIIPTCGRISIRASVDDITKYISWKLLDLSSFKTNISTAIKERKELKEEILKKLVANSKGMFLLPCLHLEELSTKSSVLAFRKALDTLPVEVNETYRQAMDRIHSQASSEKEIALKALKWTLNATKILDVEELRHALAIEPDENENDDDIDKDALCLVQDVISASAGLLEVDQMSQTIRLVHFTAKEYFQKTAELWFPNAQRDLAKECIAYACLPSMRTVDKWAPSFSLRDSHPLFSYVIKNIGVHLKASLSTENVQLHLQYLNRLQNSPEALKAIAQYHLPELFPYLPSQPYLMEFPPAHVAATFQIPELIKFICEQDPEAASVLDSCNNTPVHIASCLGDVRSLEELLKTHGNLDGCNRDNMNPLHYAVRGRSGLTSSTVILKLLLQAGANPNVNFLSGTPLIWVVKNRRKSTPEIVKLLIAAGAEVNVKEDDPSRKSALLYAAESGDLEVVQCLVEAGAQMDSRDSAGDTALIYAAMNARFETVRFLVRSGSKINEKGCRGWSPLMAAAYNKHIEVLRFLIEEGAPIDEKDDSGVSALMNAARQGDLSIIRFLVESRADVNDTDMSGKSVLMYAAGSWAGDATVTEALRFLIEEGARVNDKDASGQTALLYATVDGNPKTLNFLLEKEADINATDREGESALIKVASKIWGLNIVRLLVERGAQVEVQNQNGYSALDCAERCGAVRSAEYLKSLEAQNDD